MTRFAAAVILAASVASPAAWSAPPPVGSEDWEIMAPYAAWIETQRDQIGRICCDWSDARPVQVRQRLGKWEVQFVRPRDLPPPYPDGWQVVPDHAVLRDRNGRAVVSPVGLSIAWWYAGEVRCFTVPAEG